MPKLKKINLNRRWINARPGSVLILVIALLVLLALIGTAYLSSTQTERYTSQQNTINTEADLLIQGMVSTLNAEIVNGVFGTAEGQATGTGSQYRPPYQDAPNTSTLPTLPSGAYYNYDSAVTDPTVNNPPAATGTDPADLWLADRTPVLTGSPTAPTIPTWGNISWPLFKDATGGYTFDSPLTNTSIQLGTGYNKGTMQFVPTNTGAYPAMMISGPQSPLVAVGSKPFSAPAGSIYNGVTPVTVYAASAAGDGIADALFCKVPVGQIDGVTYYVATRVIDNNSAINGSTAWSQGNDTMFAANAATNFGMFRTNIGLQELLYQTTASSEINALNQYRFLSVTNGNTAPTLNQYPYPDATVVNGPTNFTWYSYGDLLDHQLISRPGSPGYTASGTYPQFLGLTQSAALAYKFSLTNPYTTSQLSPLEQYLPNELSSQSTPYSAAQSSQWYSNLFSGMDSYTGGLVGNTPTAANGTPGSSFPLRTILTGNNAVSNAIPSWLGNTSSNPVTPWSGTTTYKFGDWVTDSNDRTFVCLVPHTDVEPSRPFNFANGYGYGSNLSGNVTMNAPADTPEYWAFEPWSQQPTKTSVNTGTFEQLWLAFAQVMTNTISTADLPAYAATAVPQWQPPVQAANQTMPLPMFCNVIGRTGSTVAPLAGTSYLSSSQMLKLRAAIAAANTINMRSGTDVTGSAIGSRPNPLNPPFSAVPLSPSNMIVSRRIFLPGPSIAAASAAPSTGSPTTGFAAGNNGFEVEIYGNKPGPFICEMVVEIEPPPPGGGAATPNFIAIELINPYASAMKLTNWQLATMDRSTLASMGYMSLTPLALDSTTPVITIPAAAPDALGVLQPGIAVIASALAPPAPNPPPGGTQYPSIYFANNAWNTMMTNTAVVPGYNFYLCPTLTNAIGKEFVLLRPRRSLGTLSSSATGDDYNESTNIADLVPVDQLDLTGADTITAGTTPVRLQYRRADQGATGSTASYAWNYVYPGPYTLTPAAGQLRMTGIVVENFPGAANSPPLSTGQLGLPKGAGPAAGGTPTSTGAGATYPTAPLQMINLFTGGPNPLNYSNPLTANTFPFGQFARNLDMLQIPFICSYRIRTPAQRSTNGGNAFVELNSVTMDSALVMDTTLSQYGLDATYGAGKTTEATPIMYEQLGHFCPVGQFGSGGTYDFGSTQSLWHYHWTEKLLTYLTVQSPQDDYYPNVDPAGTNSARPLEPGSNLVYPGSTTASPRGSPAPVSNNSYNSTAANATTAGSSEDTAGNEGLININTAPAIVLAQLPFYASGSPLPAGTSTSTIQQANAWLAQKIVLDRNKNGPFKTVYDLMRVPEFQQASTGLASNAVGAANGEPGPANGDFSPGGLPTNPPAATLLTDNVRFDYKEQFLLLNNISNLITTRSDTFTCYVLLQGWRNVGTNNPTLAVQRRAAYIFDRNGITPSNNVPVVYKVPTD